MNVEERARDLGQAIAESLEYKLFVEREEVFLKTQDAVDLMKDFEREVSKLQNLQALGLEVPPSALSDLKLLEERIRGHVTIQQLFQAQKDYEDLLRKVNEAIGGAIEGRGPQILTPDGGEAPRSAGRIRLEGV